MKVDKSVPTQFPRGEPYRLAVIGEAPGELEALRGEPFIGPSGDLLNRVLRNLGIDRANCLVTNVFRKRPPRNDLAFFFDKKVAAKKSGWDKQCPRPPHTEQGYVKAEWAGELDRLYAELAECRPHMVVALGATALWALSGESKIGAHRGTLMEVEGLGIPMLATFHPAAVLRNWSQFMQFYYDIRKAWLIATDTLPPPLNREIWIAPTLADLETFRQKYIRPGSPLPLAVDIETGYGQITCIGFAPDKEHALVVPFFDKRKPDWSYWATAEEEARAWKFVASLLQDSKLDKLFHNCAYDAMWLRRFGVTPMGVVHDSMLMHHSLQPELKKSLGLLGSLYANESSWKQLVNWSTVEEKTDA